MQKLAWILIGVSFLGLMGWGVYAFLADESIPLLMKIAIGAIGIGVLILFGVAIRDRFNKSKTDQFKEVDN